MRIYQHHDFRSSKKRFQLVGRRASGKEHKKNHVNSSLGGKKGVFGMKR